MPHYDKGEHVTLKTSSSIGNQLKAAREALHLSAQDIAKRLRLKLEIIQLLEADNFARAPEPVFVRGYLRAYAKVVRLSQDAIVQQYNQSYVQVIEKVPYVTDPVAKPKFISKFSFPLKDKSMRWLSYGIISTLIVLFALGWYSHYAHTQGAQEGFVRTTLLASPDSPVAQMLLNKSGNELPSPLSNKVSVHSIAAVKEAAEGHDETMVVESETKPASAPAVSRAKKTPRFVKEEIE